MPFIMQISWMRILILKMQLDGKIYAKYATSNNQSQNSNNNKSQLDIIYQLILVMTFVFDNDLIKF